MTFSRPFRGLCLLEEEAHEMTALKSVFWKASWLQHCAIAGQSQEWCGINYHWDSNLFSLNVVLNNLTYHTTERERRDMKVFFFRTLELLLRSCLCFWYDVTHDEKKNKPKKEKQPKTKITANKQTKENNTTPTFMLDVLFSNSHFSLPLH